MFDARLEQLTLDANAAVRNTAHFISHEFG